MQTQFPVDVFNGQPAHPDRINAQPTVTQTQRIQKVAGSYCV